MSATALVQSLSASDALTVTRLFDVSGWVAVVTGGGTGLGLVTALALANNGAKVYITGRRLEPLEEAARAFAKANAANGNGHTNGHANAGAIVPVQADASTKEGIAALVAAVSAEDQWVNLLVNNHGVSLGCANINECAQTAAGISAHMFAGESFDAWLDTYRINTASYFFTTMALLPLLDAAKARFPEPGNVINVSSMSGITKTSQRGQFNYNASKAATILLSHMLATEMARRGLGIRVNVVCPGYFPTGMTVIPNESNTGSEAHTAEFRGKWGIPFGRPGNATDYAQCIFGLATNQYVTGAEMVIDGGWLLEAAF